MELISYIAIYIYEIYIFYIMYNYMFLDKTRVNRELSKNKIELHKKISINV